MHRALGVFQGVGDGPALLVIHRAGLGQAQLAGGAAQQLDADRLFQLAHPSADRSLGDLQRMGGGGETAEAHHPHKYQRVIQIADHSRPFPRGTGLCH